MFKRLIAKGILVCGLVIIVVLCIVLFYVSYKVKKDLENNLNQVFSDSTHYSDQISDKIPKAFLIKPFKCSGIMSFKCSSNLELKTHDEVLAKLDNFSIIVEQIRMDSVVIKTDSKIVFSSSFYSDYPAMLKLLPHYFKINLKRSVLDRKRGVILDKVDFELDSDATSLKLGTQYELESKKFINRNAIQSIQISKDLYDGQIDLDDKIGIHKISAYLRSKQLKTAMMQLMQEKKIIKDNNESDYESKIDESFVTIGFLAGMMGPKGYILQTNQLLKGLSELLKDQVKELSLEINSQEGSFKRWSVRELENLDLESYYDVRVESQK